MSKNSFYIISICLVAFFFSACRGNKSALPDGVTVTKKACADRRVDLAFDHHLRSKEFLSSYYKTRKESELFFAWYAREDSNHMANSVTKCFDRQNKHFYAVRNVIKKNNVLKDLIVQNMRLDSQAQVSELFLEEYQKIFVRDIQ